MKQGILYLFVLLLACESTNENKSLEEELFTLSGSVTGLNDSLQIQLNTIEILTLKSNGNFVFQEKLSAGSSYKITLLSENETQSCVIMNDSGTIQEDVTDILIHCSEKESSDSVLYSENFNLADGSAWPSPWQIVSEVNSPVLHSDIQNGRARLSGTQGVVTRMINRSVIAKNFDAYFTVEYENFNGQGIGFYGRQNGGRLTATNPKGQGYAVFLEGNGTESLDLWYEEGGVEILAASTHNPLGINAIQDDTEYRIRFQVEQISENESRIRSKLWLKSEAEPDEWQVVLNSTHAHLQNISDGFAIDIYNYLGTDAIYIDDILIKEL